MEVIYHGIRLTPDEIVSTVEQEDVDLIGLSILSGSHLTVVPRIIEIMKEKGCGNTPLIVDIDEETLCMSLDSISENMSNDVGAILWVHMAGLVTTDVLVAREICKKL